MSEDTAISWTGATWNPVHGCSKVSAGCANCYAERISFERFGHTDHPWTAENAAENVSVRPERLDFPSTLDEPQRVFVNSMSDLFHPEVGRSFVVDVFDVIRSHPEHVFQILTKRPERAIGLSLDWPANVWMGVSVEHRETLDRLDTLRECDAETLFVSFEPLIGPVAESADDLDLRGIGWVIVGGESAPDDVRRDLSHEWVWPIRRACMKRGVTFFFKQSSARRPEQDQKLRCPDGVRREFREMPPLPDVTLAAREGSA